MSERQTPKLTDISPISLSTLLNFSQVSPILLPFKLQLSFTVNGTPRMGLCSSSSATVPVACASAITSSARCASQMAPSNLSSTTAFSNGFTCFTRRMYARTTATDWTCAGHRRNGCRIFIDELHYIFVHPQRYDHWVALFSAVLTDTQTIQFSHKAWPPVDGEGGGGGSWLVVERVNVFP